MLKDETSAWAMTVGLYRGAGAGRGRNLLYKTLLRDAVQYGVSSGSVLQSIEGSTRGRGFRSVENEIASNELPMMLRFIDEPIVLLPYVFRALELVQTDGIVVVDMNVKWWRPKETIKARRAKSTASSHSDLSSESLSGAKHVDDGGARALQTHQGLEVEIYLMEASSRTGKPTYQAVTELLRSKGAAWVSTTRGVTGFGAERRMYRSKWWGKGEVPVMIFVIDREERVRPYLGNLVDIVGPDGVVVSRPVTLYRL